MPHPSIDEGHYTPRNRSLMLGFGNGTAKMYRDVPESLWEEIQRTQAGPEVLKFWEERINGKYSELEIPLFILQLARMGVLDALDGE